MRLRLLAVFSALAGVALATVVAVAPAQANAQDTSFVVDSASTTETADCHYSTGGSVYNTRYMFDGDTLTVNYAHDANTRCNSNWTTSPDDSRWYYSAAPYVKVNQSVNGPTGVEGPGSPLAIYRFADRQCEQQSDIASPDWATVPYFISQVQNTMSSSVTAGDVFDPGSSMIYAYDLGTCGSWGWDSKQIVYIIKPVEPTVSAAFTDTQALFNTPTELVFTITNTQILRADTYSAFTGVGFNINLPAGATGSSPTTTCRGGSASLAASDTQVVLDGASLGGSGYETEGSCTVTVQVTFPTGGTQTVNNDSVDASYTNRGGFTGGSSKVDPSTTPNPDSMFLDVNASIDIVDAVLEPATQTIDARQGTKITPTTPFTPQGFSGTVQYSVSPNLPAGLTLDPSTGVISGTPTAQQGALTYTITATDGVKTATAEVTITVGEPDATGGLGLVDTGTSLRVALGVTITGLLLWGLAWFALSGRRRLGWLATDLRVRDMLKDLDARLNRIERPFRRRRPPRL